MIALGSISLCSRICLPTNLRAQYWISYWMILTSVVGIGAK